MLRIRSVVLKKFLHLEDKIISENKLKIQYMNIMNNENTRIFKIR